jgi:hypothetical protein
MKRKVIENFIEIIEVFYSQTEERIVITLCLRLFNVTVNLFKKKEAQSAK